jgi:arylsulfatase A-like enzyme
MAGIGIVAVAGSVLIDYVWSGGSRGFGLFQWLLLSFGILLFLAGQWLTIRGRERLRSGTVKLLGREVRVKPVEVIGLALVFGLLTGLGECVILFAEREFAGRMLRMGEELLWILPVMDSLVLLIVGAAFVIVGIVVPAVRSVYVVGFAFSMLCANALLSRLTLVERMEDYALIVLVVGLSVVMTRRLAERRPAARKLLRGSGVVAVVVLVLGLSGPLLRAVAERRALGRLGEATAGAPNVLFVIWDTVRARNLSLYGYERPTTERLESFAESALTFDLAVSPASWTLPSHGSMFTGRYPDRLNATWQLPLDGTYPTLAEVLSEHGWATAGFSANMAYVTRESGLARGFTWFEDYHIAPGRMVFVTHMALRALLRLGLLSDRATATIGLKRGSKITRGVLNWLEDRPRDRPFFVFANYMDAHDPYDAPGRFKAMYGPEPENFQSSWIGFREAKTARVQAQLDSYDACITYLDDQLGTLLDSMEREGLLENTIVVIASDHGEHFGENGFMRHGTTLYLPTIHVPLIIRAPGTPAGVRVAERVTTRDVPATILDLAGVTDDRIAGESIRPVWEGHAGNSLIFSEVRQGIRIPPGMPTSDGDLYSLIDDRYHYIRRTDNGGEELYDYLADYAESLNLAPAGTADTVLAIMRDAMQRHLSNSRPWLATTAR